MIIIRDEKKPLTCDQCWAYDKAILHGESVGVCLITYKLSPCKWECPMEEVDDG